MYNSLKEELNNIIMLCTRDNNTLIDLLPHEQYQLCSKTMLSNIIISNIKLCQLI